MTQALVDNPVVQNDPTATIPNPISERLRWTSEDLELLPENGNRYEIVDGELYVTRAPHWNHQKTCGKFYVALQVWSDQTGLGEAATGIGVIFGNEDDVIPDVIWISKARYTALIDQAGHLLGAPEIVIEVLSAGTENEKRDRQVKLKLYSARGVLEYWIADWRNQEVQVYRRENGILKLAVTLYASDVLTSPLLPEFTLSVGQVFA